MSDNSLGDYFYAQAKREAAYEGYNYAAARLEIESIKERLAEIRSHTQPLDGLLEKKLSERERLYAAAFYVVVGRMPSEVKAPSN